MDELRSRRRSRPGDRRAAGRTDESGSASPCGFALTRAKRGWILFKIRHEKADSKGDFVGYRTESAFIIKPPWTTDGAAKLK